MEIEFFSYGELENFLAGSALDLAQTIIVYDTRPLFIDKDTLLDCNTFCLKTWRNQFVNSQEKVCIFLVKKFSAELTYALYKNRFKKTLIFTNDSYLEGLFKAPSSSINIVIYNHVESMSFTKFRKLINIEYIQNLSVKDHELENAFNYFVKFIQYYTFWLNYFQGLSSNPSVGTVFLLSNQEEKVNLYSSLDSPVCLILDYQDQFDFSRFKSVYFISTDEQEDANVVPDEHLFKFFCNAFLQIENPNTFNLLSLTAKGLLTYSRFSDFQKILNRSVLEKLTQKIRQSIDFFPYLKANEFCVGNCMLPFSSSQTLLLSILQDVRNKLKENGVYLKQLAPEFEYNPSGKKVKKYSCKISFSVLFTVVIQSSVFINKKDSCYDACGRFIQHLIDIDILDPDMNVKSINLMKLDQVKEFVYQKYEGNINALQDTANTVLQLPDEYYRNLVVVNGSLKIIDQKNTNPEEKLLKSMYTLDCNPAETKKESISDINERLAFYYRKIPAVFQKNTSFLSLYTFSNSKTGILCAYSEFNDTTITSDLLEKIKIKGSKPIKYTQEELDMIKYYQLIFFKVMSLPVLAEKQEFSLHYFVVPIDDAYEIDWTYLKRLYNLFLEDYSYNVKDDGTFLWNHVIGEFIYFSKFSDYKLSQVVEDTSIQSFFEKKFNMDFEKSENSLIIEACLSAQVSSLFKKKFNYFINETVRFIDQTKQAQIKSENFITHGSHPIEQTIDSSNFIMVNKIKACSPEANEIPSTFNGGCGFSEIKYQIFRYLIKSTMSDAITNKKSNSLYLNSLHTNTNSNLSENSLNLIKDINHNSEPDKAGQPNKDNRNYTKNSFVISSSQSQSTIKSQGLVFNFDQVISSNILPEISTVYLYPSEVCYKTPVRHSTIIEAEIFKRNFKYIEDVFIANEIANRYDMSAGLDKIIQCFTSSTENNDLNYERLEFLGDCVLKFIVTNHLFLTGYAMNNIVSVKDSIICNENLYRCCRSSGFIRYIRRQPFNMKMLQPPKLENYDELINYFKISNVFLSNNYHHFSPKGSNFDELGIKFYADVIEAFIGLIYLTQGIDHAYKFIKNLGIIYKVTDLPSTSKNKDRLAVDYFGDVAKNSFQCTVNSKNSLFFGYTYNVYNFMGYLNESDLSSIEDIFGYVFKNKGNLERASVHPSFSNSLDSFDFQFLELIGDSALDMFVNSFLFPNKAMATPLMLHTAKMSYVNNISLRKIFFATHLDHCAKTGASVCNESKAHSDIVEAIIGAILVDLEWDVLELNRILSRKFKKYLEEHRSSV